MRLTLVIIGMFFLFNPAVNVVDPLPDFIGYIFIAAGLSRISCLVDKLADARATFRRLAIITAVKIISVMFLVIADDTFVLVLAFSFAVIELMCIYPAFDRLFDGLFYAGTRNGGTAVFRTKTKRIKLSEDKAKKLVLGGADDVIEETLTSGERTYYREKTVDRGNTVKAFTLIFMTVKLVLNVLPELTSLQLYDHFGAVSQSAVNLVQYKPMFYIIVWALTLLVGIPWLVMITSYLVSVVKDKEFISTLERRYETEIVPDKTRSIVGNMSAVIALVSLGVVFTFDLYIDHVNVTPNFIAAVFMISALAILAKYRKAAAVGIVSASLWGVMSGYNLYRQNEYFAKYTLRRIFTNPEAAEMYSALKISMMIEFFLGELTYVILAIILIKVTGEHIGLIGLRYAGVAEIPAEDRNKDIRFTVKSRLIAIAVLACIAAVASASYPIFVPEFDYAFPITAGVQIVMIAYALFSLITIGDEVYKRLRGDY